MILDNASSHVVSFAKVGKSCGFSALQLSNMNLVFLPSNVTSVVQPLDPGRSLHCQVENHVQREKIYIF
jgi:hypothetical protein